MARRFRVLFLSAVLACGGCRPADPLEWKIKGETPRELNQWLDDVGDKLPTDLKEEFRDALLIVRGDVGPSTPRSMLELRNKLCLRLDQRTVRQVLLDGYHVEKISLLQRLGRESDNMAANLKVSELMANDPKKMQRAESIQAYQEKNVALIKKRIAEIETRVAALSPPAH